MKFKAKNYKIFYYDPKDLSVINSKVESPQVFLLNLIIKIRNFLKY